MNKNKYCMAICLISFVSFYAYSASKGKEMALHITSNYTNVVTNCGSSNRPAFLCSGVLFRATNPDTGYNSWDPSPVSIKSGGVSFSYLRKDSKFSRLAFGYLNGFILYPYSYAPKDKNTNINVMCAFPIDSFTTSRSRHGCGAYNLYPIRSRPCQDQGIFTANQWASHYKWPWFNKRQKQCGFIVSENSNINKADAFYQTIKAMKLIPYDSIKTQNELRLATWNTNATGYPKTLPIEAFFYIYKQSRAMPRTAIEKGLTGARYDQKSYFNKTGVWVPIIRISLPSSYSDEAKFEFFEKDQSISER